MELSNIGLIKYTGLEVGAEAESGRVTITEQARNERGAGGADEALVYALLDLGFALADRSNELIADILRELGLTVPLANALWKLDPGAPAPSMREVAAGLRCDPSTVTFLADRLEERGLAERRINPANRRSNNLVLTTKGADVRRKLVEAMATRSPMARLSVEEQRQLRYLLSKAIKAN